MMKKIRMCFPNEKTFQEGFEEYINIIRSLKQEHIRMRA